MLINTANWKPENMMMPRLKKTLQTGIFLTLSLPLAHNAFAKSDILLKAEQQFSQLLPLCLEANRERRSTPLAAQETFTRYEREVQKILQELPDFEKQANESIQEQLAYCDNVKKTVNYEVAKYRMQEAIETCQRVDAAFDAENLAQAEELLESFEQQKQRSLNIDPDVLSVADKKAEIVHCEKRKRRAERWRALIRETSTLIRAQAGCNAFRQTLDEASEPDEQLLEKAQQQVRQTENELTRVQGQVEPLLDQSSEFSDQMLESYNNGVSSMENCIAAINESLPDGLPSQPQTEPQLTVTDTLQKRCQSLLQSATAPSLSADQFGELKRAKAKFVTALERLEAPTGQGGDGALAECAVDLEVAFVAAEASLLDATQAQDGARQRRTDSARPTPLSGLPASGTASTAAPLGPTRQDVHPLIERLRNLRAWRKNTQETAN